MPIRGTKIRHAIGAVSILAQISLLMREARWQRQQRCCVFLFGFGFDKKKQEEEEVEGWTKII